MNDADVLFPWEKHGGDADCYERDPDAAEAVQAGPVTPDTVDALPATDATRSTDQPDEQSGEAASAEAMHADADDATHAETSRASAADADADAADAQAPAGGGDDDASGDDAAEDESRFAVLDTGYAREAAERASAALREKPVAQKEYYSISEVCDLVGLKPHVLRYWETQFQVLNPSKNRSGNRVYQRKEIRLITLVRHLLYEEKYTVEGAKAKLDQLRRSGDLAAAVGPVLDRVMIDQLRAELSELTTLLTPPARM